MIFPLVFVSSDVEGGLLNVQNVSFVPSLTCTFCALGRSFWFYIDKRLEAGS